MSFMNEKLDEILIFFLVSSMMDESLPTESVPTKSLPTKSLPTKS